MVLVMKLGMVGAVENPGDDDSVSAAGLSRGTGAGNPGDGVAAGTVFCRLSPCKLVCSVGFLCSRLLFLFPWLVVMACTFSFAVVLLVSFLLVAGFAV